MTPLGITPLANEIQGPLVITPHGFSDERGDLVKNFCADMRLGKFFTEGVSEAFYTRSHKGVLRGLHFQTGPHELEKIVHVIHGAILDVIIDLRPSSATFKSVSSILLDAKNKTALYVPRGFAHGYLALETDTYVYYLQSGTYRPQHESGVHFASIGFDWGITKPVVSTKDSQLPRLDDLSWNS